MRILVDTNRIIAAMVKAGTTGNILFDENFEFMTPDYTITEIREHEDELLKKTKLTKEEFEILLAVNYPPLKRRASSNWLRRDKYIVVKTALRPEIGTAIQTRVKQAKPASVC